MNIYGNYFYQNNEEFLFQGEGNIAFYNNVLVNTTDFGNGIVIRPHNGEVRNAHIFYNTILVRQEGILVSSNDRLSKIEISSNVVLAETPISSNDAFANTTNSFIVANEYIKHPENLESTCSLYPESESRLSGRRFNPIYYKQFPNSKFDFNGYTRGGYVRGAFSATCKANDWQVSLEDVSQVDYKILENL